MRESHIQLILYKYNEHALISIKFVIFIKRNLLSMKMRGVKFFCSYFHTWFG
jgi:hypothetical protein